MHKCYIKYFRSDMCLQAKNQFLREYLNQRHDILIELLRHELFPSMSSGTNCNKTSGTYRCWDLLWNNTGVAPVVFPLNAMAPFHRIQIWNGAFFERSIFLWHELLLELLAKMVICDRLLYRPQLVVAWI